jgi:hypothetical protein
MGYETSPPEPGEPLVIFTRWRVEKELPADLSAFVHLVDGADSILAQHDGFDAAATTLQRGDMVLQRHVLTVDGSLPEAEYMLYVGLYRRDTEQRLIADQTSMDRFMVTAIIIDEK